MNQYTMCQSDIKSSCPLQIQQEPLPKLSQLRGVFLRHSCIKSCTFLVPSSLTNSLGLLFFGPQVPPGLLWIQKAGEYGPASASQIYGRSPDRSTGIPDQFWCLGCCDRGKLHFSPITRHPWLPHGAPLRQILPGRMPIRGNLFFPPDHAASQASWRPFPPIISGRIPIRGKCSPRLFPLPGIHPGRLRLLPYVSPLCMHLLIANIFDV